ncbi:MAG: pitrilysin family protein [Bacteroidota bacterium]
MIHYQSFILSNGLQVFVHEDHSTPMAVLNICYNVGSRDEEENKTGFAHLFEHLMFGGSKNIPSYDTPLQKVGGENNAFTSPDITNYYITLPAVNIETAFWLESDRMLSLSFDPQVLEVQRKVVIEEFKQRYLNQPYGDAWLKLRPLAYQAHPYKWATIGKDISHIEEANMEDVKDFFQKHYLPNNAVLVIAGNITLEQIKNLSKKWFEPIPAGNLPIRNLKAEPKQIEARTKIVEAKVPLNAIYKAYHMPGRHADNFHEVDLFSDILGRGKSSRLHENLVKKEPIFGSIAAYVTSSLDPGLLMIQGNLNVGIDLNEADQAINHVVDELFLKEISEAELEKVKNQSLTTHAFAEVELLNRAMALAFSANAGNVDFANLDSDLVAKVSKSNLLSESQKVMRPENCSTLFYKAVS